MGKIITPTVKMQIGATTISIDSKDMNLFSNILRNSSKYFLSHAYLYLKCTYSLHLYILLSKNEKKIKNNNFSLFSS